MIDYKEGNSNVLPYAYDGVSSSPVKMQATGAEEEDPKVEGSENVEYVDTIDHQNFLDRNARPPKKIKGNMAIFEIFNSSKAIEKKSIPLSHPFFHIDRVNLKEIDVITQQTFQELIMENEGLGVPFYITLVRDDGGQVQAYDTRGLLRLINEFGEIITPDTRLPFHEAIVYGITSLGDPGFQYLCDFSSLRNDNDHKAKLILATLNEQSIEARATDKFLVGRDLESKGDKKLAKYWYNKALEDKSPQAALHLFRLHQKKSKSKAAKYLALARDFVEDPEQKKILSAKLDQIKIEIHRQERDNS